MLDVIMEGNEDEMEEFGPSLSEDLLVCTHMHQLCSLSSLFILNGLFKSFG